jgi:hypothetical protein
MASTANRWAKSLIGGTKDALGVKSHLRTAV